MLLAYAKALLNSFRPRSCETSPPRLRMMHRRALNQYLRLLKPDAHSILF